MESNYYEKYIKYKQKYIELQKELDNMHIGGGKKPTQSPSPQVIQKQSSVKSSIPNTIPGALAQSSHGTSQIRVIAPQRPAITSGPVPMVVSSSGPSVPPVPPVPVVQPVPVAIAPVADPIGAIKESLDSATHYPNLPAGLPTSNTLNVYKITLDTIDKLQKMILEPYNEFGYLVDQPNITSKLVVFYKLTYIKYQDAHQTIVDNKVESIIPYYVSDGQTNKFRAGMLFPFICINEATENSTCPVGLPGPHLRGFPGPHVRGLLYKYKVTKNMNMRNFMNWVARKLYYHIVPPEPHGLPDPPRPLAQLLQEPMRGWLLEYYGSLYSGHSPNGGDLQTVLPRIENLLDFLISVYSDRIMHFEPGNIFHVDHSPNYVQSLFNNSFVPPPQSSVKENDNYNYSHDYSLLPAMSPNERYFRPYVRLKLRDLFFDMAHHFVSTGLINVEQCPLTIKRININQLDDIINICNIPDSVNPSLNINFENYKIVSQNLYDIFWDKFRNLKKLIESKPDPSINPIDINNLIWMTKFEPVQIPSPINTYNNGNLEHFISTWNAQCRKR